MTMKDSPELSSFLSTYIFDADPDSEPQAVGNFVAASSRDQLERVISQARVLIEDTNLSLEELGAQANRWFGEVEEAQGWLRGVLGLLESANSADTPVVK